MKYIDLRSDTITEPTDNIREAMRNAIVGDDCFGDDRAVNQLQEYCKKFFRTEDALLTCGGTMSNQIALLSLTNAGDEVILDASYHINFFESGSSSRLAGVCFNLINTEDGIYNVDNLDKAINTKSRWNNNYPHPKVICLENTVGSKGGSVFSLEKIKEISRYAKQRDIFLYLDGARILNASAYSNVHPSEYLQYVDGMSMCFSKGLCAPLGSIMVGKKSFIDSARKYRKWIGGDMHQFGVVAAPAHYALKHHWELVGDDNDKMNAIYLSLRGLNGVDLIYHGTNMMYISAQSLGTTAQDFVALAEEKGLKMIAWDDDKVRLVTHFHVKEEDALVVSQTLLDIIAHYQEKLTLTCEPSL
ncbi:threonine aldolase [Vibrio crassostreae]|uniref:threonine aldolase family protein n=1 Tax=Vibrio sp. L5-1 TaxID=2912254 RepID=UPI001F01B4AC|nr:GntG family PLP-dependent aldolase [Vibrio sp. L5-1]CAK3054932.1 threonine aldolase [Vibrio crassostreae]MCF7497032.1 aminotransferase class I/II-fold pyridoxal phosphate-dependent enzyme [Vibrio sp. L5-1]CAK3060429.1 threonine aldolase [Vibrio crassostreae]CAK3070646.1 threonine aldolase [Vibrio crassostreae]CAK3072643.1 threonine aldolase [Vibrio crassostreae]